MATDIYDSTNYLTLDFETTNINKGDPVNKDNQLILACWKYQGKLKHTWGNEYQQQDLVRDVEAADFIVAHNVKFEYGWLKRCGIQLEDMLSWDTMLAEKVIVSNKKGMKVALEETLGRYGLGIKDPISGAMIKAGICPTEIPKHFLLRYCYLDVIQTERLFIQQQKIVNSKLTNVIYSRNMLTPALTDIEFQGLNVDKEAVHNEFRKESTRMAELSRRFESMCGDINPRSPKQMAELLYERLGFDEPKDRRGNPIRTGANGRKTDQTTIAGFKAANQQQREFIECFTELKKLDTKINKYLSKLEAAADNDDLLYAKFNQTIADTQRLSSNGSEPYKIQFQNISREYKKFFVPRRKGWKMVAIDYAQLEFRVAALLSQDERAIEDIRAGFDVHSYTASIIFKKDLQWILDNKNSDPVAKDMRQSAKANTFKPTFGGTSGTKDEQNYFKAFKQKYSTLASEQRDWVNRTLNNKQLEMITGLIFYFPDAKMHNSGYVFRNEQIHNYPIQCFAAEIVGAGVRILWKRMREEQIEGFLVNTVHDSVIAEVSPQSVEKYAVIARESLTEGVVQHIKEVYDIDINVPLEVDVTIADYWKG